MTATLLDISAAEPPELDAATSAVVTRNLGGDASPSEDEVQTREQVLARITAAPPAGANLQLELVAA